METLASSSANSVFNDYGGRTFCSSKNASFNRPETCVLLSKRPANAVRFLHFFSLQHKILKPIRLSASLSPESQVNSGTGGAEIQDMYQSRTVHVKVQLKKECLFGEHFFLVGDDPMFGLWEPTDAVPLNWSAGHVWSVELDIPIGKSIQFKFILKGINGMVLWQPGPDRLLQTWETRNTITIIEDWENAEDQKVIEEEPFDEEPTTNSEMSIIADNLTHPEEKQDEHVPDLNKRLPIVDGNTYMANKPLPSTHEELVFGKNVVSLQEEPMAIVAENISSLGDTVVKSSHEVHNEKIINHPKESAAVLDQNAIAEDVPRNNVTATVGKNPVTDYVKENLIMQEEGPVLVPGLTQISAVATEEASRDEGETSLAVNASVGVDETKSQSLSELDAKQEPESHTCREETMVLSKNEAGLDKELEQEHEFSREEEQSDTKLSESGVLQSDIQWGRRTLYKLLTSFGFF